MPLAAPIVSCHSDATPSGPRWPGYPKFPFDLPLVADQGGPKLTSPNIVVYIDPNDPQKPEILAALDSLRTSDYWRTTTSEYGIGPIGDVKVLDPPSPFPASITERGIANLVARFFFDTNPDDPWLDGGVPPIEVDGGSSDGGVTMAPPPRLHADTLYVVILPPSTTVTDLSCSSVLGAHGDVRPTMTDAIPYAFTRSECPPEPPFNFTRSQTFVHEIVEAATDPFPGEAPAMYGLDPQHAAWNWLGIAGEVADLCTAFPAQIDTNPPALVAGMSTTPLVFPSIWSNQRVMNGLDPCLPVSQKDPRHYIQALPVVSDQVTLFDGVVVPGVNVTLNQSVTIPVRITADRPTTTIMVSALAASRDETMPEIRVSFDPPTASNGDVLNMTLTRLAAPNFEPTLRATMVIINATTDSDSVGFNTSLPVGMSTQ
jgi:hypothetical protein